MKHELDPRIESELMAGERVLWAGQPDPMRLMLRSQSPVGASRRWQLVTASLLLLALGAFIAAGTATSATTMTLLLVSLVVLFAGAIGGAALDRYLTIKNTVYAVTDRRALIKVGSKVRSYNEENIAFIERDMHSSYSGDVIFNTETQETFVPMFMVINRKESKVPVGFFNIPDAASVEAVMLETFRPQDAADDLFYDENDDAYTIENDDESDARLRA